MAQTRMFRDRVVSMEQTLEGGEKHLALLKDLCREALPELEFREYSLDHERDLFVMDLAGAAGVSRRICWTRMVLFDAERIPAMGGEAGAALRAKIVEFLRARAAQPEIVVTFRHLEDGWVDTPEPRREGRRRRRGGRGRGQGQDRGGERRGGPQPPGDRRPGRGASDRRPGGSPGQERRSGGAPPQERRQGEHAGQPQRGGGTRSPQPPRPAPATADGQAPGEPGAGRSRRRFRRRRRGRGGSGGGGAGSGPAPGGAPQP